MMTAPGRGGGCGDARAYGRGRRRFEASASDRRLPTGVLGVHVGARRHDLVDAVEDGGIEATSAAGSCDSNCSMVRGPMMAEVTAGCSSTKPSASSIRPMPGLVGEGPELGDQLELALVGRDPEVVAGRDPPRATARVGLAYAEPARQPAAGQRAPAEHPHAVGLGHGQHVAFDPPHQDGVRRLLGPETLPSPALGRPLGLDDLLGRERRRPEGPDLPGVDQVAQSPSVSSTSTVSSGRWTW